MTRSVLALNAGSSTLKYSLYHMDGRREGEVLSGCVKTQDNLDEALSGVLSRVVAEEGRQPDVIGHRVVHGGSQFNAPVLVTHSVLEQLEELVSLAPLHLPPALDLMRFTLEKCARALHVASFDTSFHRTLPEVARRLPLSTELAQQGIMRYGFHGLSYEYVLSMLGEPAPARLIVAHLGNGASLAAIHRGRSIDTSMGFTPTGGIPMGTRSGDLDPGVVLYLLRERGYSEPELDQLLNHGSGLLGLGGSSEMSELLPRADAGDIRAQAALESFTYAIKKQIGAYFAVLGGLDCLVFTGGIGEHAPRVRQLVCNGMEALGIELAPALNAKSADVISRSSSACTVRVVRTNEDLVIARAAYGLSHSAQT